MMGQKFYVYTNVPNDKALIHLADCSHCNHGLGRGVESDAANGEWHGPFHEDQARAVAIRSRKRRIQWCGFCARKLGTKPDDV